MLFESVFWEISFVNIAFVLCVFRGVTQLSMRCSSSTLCHGQSMEFHTMPQACWPSSAVSKPLHQLMPALWWSTAGTQIPVCHKYLFVNMLSIILVLSTHAVVTLTWAILWIERNFCNSTTQSRSGFGKMLMWQHHTICWCVKERYVFSNASPLNSVCVYVAVWELAGQAATLCWMSCWTWRSVREWWTSTTVWKLSVPAASTWSRQRSHTQTHTQGKRFLSCLSSE